MWELGAASARSPCQASNEWGRCPPPPWQAPVLRVPNRVSVTARGGPRGGLAPTAELLDVRVVENLRRQVV